jgi:hypothetical protein
VFRSIESSISGFAIFSGENTAQTRDRQNDPTLHAAACPRRIDVILDLSTPLPLRFLVTTPLYSHFPIDGREEAKQTMAFPSTYDEYISKLEDIGEAILQWSDPDRLFSGHTEVRSLQCTMNSNMYRKCPMNPSFFLTRRFLNLLHSLRDGC